jgi:hypothetical protein
MAIQDDILLFEQNLGELIIKYEQYFLGIEKREPLKQLDYLERVARKYMTINITNTMLKFRVNNLISRLNTYKQYWARINRLIEDGKYSREKFKMEMHQKASNKPDRAALKEMEKMSEAERLYMQYIEARKACNLPVKNISQEMISAAIDKQRPGIMKKYHCDSVVFKVVIEEGAPKIKAGPGNTTTS